MKKILFLAVALLAGSTGWGQGVFNKYAPVAGIQMSTGLDYHNTAVAASDVTPLFGCGGSSTLFLRGDGSCTAPAGTGVTSISVPVPLTASSCSGGACSITWTTGQTANRVLATPDGTTGAVSLRALVAGDIPPIALGSTANGGVASASILLGTNGGTSNAFFSVTGPTTALRTFTFPNASATVLTTNAAVTVPQGGTGLATLTAHGVLLGEGTSNLGNVAAMAADTLLLGQGVTSDPAPVAVNNCGSATSALSYSTSTHTFGCQTITSGGTGTVTSITGGTGITSSPNPLISSGTLTVDQAFSPTWTGTHLFNGALITGSTTAGWSFGQSTGLALARIVDTTGTTGNKAWQINTNNTGTHLNFRVSSDDFTTTVANFWDITRSGAAVTDLSFGNTTNNPTYSFLGTGRVSIGGAYGGGAAPLVGVTSASPNFYGLFDGTHEALFGTFTSGGFVGTFSNHEFDIRTNNTARISVSATGNLVVNAPSSGNAFTANGIAGNFAIVAAGGTTGHGAFIAGGSTSSQVALQVQNGAQNTSYFTVIGDGGVTVGAPTGGDKGLGTVNMTGCFVNGVACLTGGTTATKFAAGVVTIGASSCTVNQNTIGISACTFNSTGNVTVTLSPAFTTGTCLVNSVDSSPALVANNPGTSVTSSANIIMRNASTSALANGIFSILCLGN